MLKKLKTGATKEWKKKFTAKICVYAQACVCWFAQRSGHRGHAKHYQPVMAAAFALDPLNFSQTPRFQPHAPLDQLSDKELQDVEDTVVRLSGGLRDDVKEELKNLDGDGWSQPAHAMVSGQPHAV